jgi:hypothetical protein
VAAENSTEVSEAEAALISEALSLARQVALFGQEDGAVVADIMQRVERITRAVMNSAWNDCLDHDLSALQTLFRTARISALFGDAWQQEAMDTLLGCGRLEVRFDQAPQQLQRLAAVRLDGRDVPDAGHGRREDARHERAGDAAAHVVQLLLHQHHPRRRPRLHLDHRRHRDKLG